MNKIEEGMEVYLLFPYIDKAPSLDDKNVIPTIFKTKLNMCIASATKTEAKLQTTLLPKLTTYKCQVNFEYNKKVYTYNFLVDSNKLDNNIIDVVGKLFEFENDDYNFRGASISFNSEYMYKYYMNLLNDFTLILNKQQEDLNKSFENLKIQKEFIKNNQFNKMIK